MYDTLNNVWGWEAASLQEVVRVASQLTEICLGLALGDLGLWLVLSKKENGLSILFGWTKVVVISLET